jgi:hypothetical protein
MSITEMDSEIFRRHRRAISQAPWGGIVRIDSAAPLVYAPAR